MLSYALLCLTCVPNSPWLEQYVLQEKMSRQLLQQLAAKQGECASLQSTMAQRDLDDSLRDSEISARIMHATARAVAREQATARRKEQEQIAVMAALAAQRGPATATPRSPQVAKGKISRARPQKRVRTGQAARFGGQHIRARATARPAADDAPLAGGHLMPAPYSLPSASTDTIRQQPNPDVANNGNSADPSLTEEGGPMLMSALMTLTARELAALE